MRGDKIHDALIPVYESGHCMNALPEVCVPNWFYKEHFEEFLGRPMTDEEWQHAKEWIPDSLEDEISKSVRQQLRLYWDRHWKDWNEEEPGEEGV